MPTVASANLLPIPFVGPCSASLEVAAVDDSRAGNGVLAEAVAPNVDEDAGVAGAVRTRDLDARGQLATVAARNLDLLSEGEEEQLAGTHDRENGRNGKGSNLHSSSCRTARRPAGRQCAAR